MSEHSPDKHDSLRAKDTSDKDDADLLRLLHNRYTTIGDSLARHAAWRIEDLLNERRVASAVAPSGPDMALGWNAGIEQAAKVCESRAGNQAMAAYRILTSAADAIRAERLPETAKSSEPQGAPTKLGNEYLVNKYMHGYHDGWNACVDKMMSAKSHGGESERIDKLTWQVRDTCTRAERAEGALRLAQVALRRWTDLYAKLQNESGERVSRVLDYNLPPADHVRALEAIEEHFKAGPESTVSATSARGE